MGTMSVPSRTLFLTLEVANEDICFFDRKRRQLKELQWQRHDWCHFVPFVMYISGAKFKEHCFNISRVIQKVIITFIIALTFTLNGHQQTPSPPT